ncbi:class I SAM-dependent methyltransferase [Martelella sp. HB161492]|uniref:methyltransferase domain-containing protein n=1 Tax=Martelella sp. HB161492 TaxID=2720726 RepID=UPI00158FE13B
MNINADIGFWDRLAARYAKSPVADQGGYERTLERTRSHLKRTDQVGELGCGTGSTALLLAAHAETYLATDFSGEMILIARHKQQQGEQQSGLDFRCATADDLAREGARFDVVLGFNYLHVVRDLPATLQAIHAMLKPGGLFISKTPCLREMNPLIRLVALPVMQLFGKAPHVTSFSARALDQALGDAGFNVIVTEYHASKGADPRPFIVAARV